MAVQDNVVISNVGVVHFKDTSGNDKVLGLCDSTDLSLSIDKERLTGGWGGAFITNLYSNKAGTLKITPSIMSMTLLEINSGSEFVAETGYAVSRTLSLKSTLDNTDIVIDLTGYTPLNDEIVVLTVNNEIVTATYATNKATLTGVLAVEGDTYFITFKEALDASVLEITTVDVPKMVTDVTVETIVHSAIDGSLVGRLLFEIPRMQGDGAVSIDLTKNTNNKSEVVFDIASEFMGTGMLKIVYVPEV